MTVNIRHPYRPSSPTERIVDDWYQGAMSIYRPAFTVLGCMFILWGAACVVVANGGRL